MQSNERMERIWQSVPSLSFPSESFALLCHIYTWYLLETNDTRNLGADKVLQEFLENKHKNDFLQQYHV